MIAWVTHGRMAIYLERGGVRYYVAGARFFGKTGADPGANLGGNESTRGWPSAGFRERNLTAVMKNVGRWIVAWPMQTCLFCQRHLR